MFLNALPDDILPPLGLSVSEAAQRFGIPRQQLLTLPSFLLATLRRHLPSLVAGSGVYA